MALEPCTCNPVPVRSSHELDGGAKLMDLVDDDGRWHAVVVGSCVYKLTLVEPSASWLAAQQPFMDAAQQELAGAQAREARFAALRDKRLGGEALTAEEMQQAIDLLLGL